MSNCQCQNLTWFILNKMRALGIIGPSGCGKTTILKKLFNEGLVYVNPTYTERPKRPGEEELEHKFVSKTKFDRLEKSGFFVEVIQAFGLKYRYGVPHLKEEKGKASLVMLRAPLVPLLIKHHPNHVIYQIEASFSLASQWMEKRGDSELGSRLDDFEKELMLGRKYAKRVFANDGDLDKCVKEIKKALKEDFEHET